MAFVNLLKPNKEKLNFFLILGALFFALGIFDFCLNNFYEKNITAFLPGFISFFIFANKRCIENEPIKQRSNTKND